MGRLVRLECFHPSGIESTGHPDGVAISGQLAVHHGVDHLLRSWKPARGLGIHPASVASNPHSRIPARVTAITVVGGRVLHGHVVAAWLPTRPHPSAPAAIPTHPVSWPWAHLMIAPPLHPHALVHSSSAVSMILASHDPIVVAHGHLLLLLLLHDVVAIHASMSSVSAVSAMATIPVLLFEVALLMTHVHVIAHADVSAVSGAVVASTSVVRSSSVMLVCQASGDMTLSTPTTTATAVVSGMTTIIPSILEFLLVVAHERSCTSSHFLRIQAHLRRCSAVQSRSRSMVEHF
mmetsp:Transcript_9208/g.18031  ORF Transcript_9208/g.18031 Transcript_9208/m.18031 type:complete len:292 (-) Transcript_9208:1160-2035(-)